MKDGSKQPIRPSGSDSRTTSLSASAAPTAAAESTYDRSRALGKATSAKMPHAFEPTCGGCSADTAQFSGGRADLPANGRPRTWRDGATHMNKDPLSGVKACVFDMHGTPFDFRYLVSPLLLLQQLFGYERREQQGLKAHERCDLGLLGKHNLSVTIRRQPFQTLAIGGELQ